MKEQLEKHLKIEQEWRAANRALEKALAEEKRKAEEAASVKPINEKEEDKNLVTKIFMMQLRKLQSIMRRKTRNKKVR